MIVGYARVSTEEQNSDLQKQALLKAGCEEIFDEHGFSGMHIDRPKLKKVINSLKKGDVLVVWKLDRLGRSLSHLVTLIEGFAKNGIQFKSLTENIDTTSPGGTLIFHMMAAMAQFERNLMVERTKAGLAAAKNRGEIMGRPKKMNTERYEVAIQLLKEGKKKIPEIAHILKVSRQTIYNEIKRRKLLNPSLA